MEVVKVFNLKALDPGHKLRNTPLWEIGVEYRVYGTKTWHLITRQYRIGKCTFNELGLAWTENTDWRVKQDG